MVLDWLIEAHKAEKHPSKMLLLSFMYCSIAIGVALLIFPREAGAAMMLLTVAAFMPFMLNLMKVEELKDEKSRFLLKNHWPALKLFVFLFFGMLVAYVIWFILLPSEISARLFSMQIETITRRGIELGALSGGGLQFVTILLNNLKVLFVGIGLAFIFGAGAIFVLEWNATVLATLLGGTLKHSLDFSAAQYLVHGIPEILGYFVGGLAGGIISIAIARHKPGTKEFKRVLIDSVELILLAVAILFLAAALEVTISPLIG